MILKYSPAFKEFQIALIESKNLYHVILHIKYLVILRLTFLGNIKTSLKLKKDVVRAIRWKS